jgi:hypothetical protein
LQQAQLGTLLIWDRQFAGSRYPELNLAALEADPTFRLLHCTAPIGSPPSPCLMVFDKTSP